MKQGDYDSEAPTAQVARTPEQRSAKLVKDWRECSEKQRRTIERIAARLAALPKVNK